MKFIVFFSLVFGFLLSSDAFANKRCGLGSKIFGKSKSIISQTFENSTNRVVGGASSIAYGTSGCKDDGMLLFEPLGKNDDQKKIEEQVHYANANYEELVYEMAAGNGETLTGFAETLGCRGDGISTFGSTTRANYSKIIQNENMAPEQMLYNVRETLRANPVLLAQCGAA
jgi:hypothetical protein